MHFHLPKPLHGWREFVGEVGIIVIGVLIALGAEQVVETIHLHQKTSDAEGRIRDEVAVDTAPEIERVAVGRCLTQRANQIAQGLASGRTDWRALLFPAMKERPMALREVYHMPSRSWVTDAYREALTQGDLASMDPAKRGLLAGLYNQIDELGELNRNEQDLVTALAPLEMNRPLSDPERNQMISTLAQLDKTNGLIMLIALQNFQSVHDLGFAIGPTEASKYFGQADSWQAELTGLRARYGDCVDPSAITQYVNIAIRGAKAP
jgi:hypothetical protein